MTTTSPVASREKSQPKGSLFSVELAVTLVAAFATLLMLEAMRVFLSYMVFVIDQGERTELATNATGIFGAFVIGGVVAKLIGARPAVALTVLLLIGTRFALQFTENPEARYYLGAATVIAWGWMLTPLRSLRPDDAARGVILGLLLDLSIRFLFGSVDLPWMPDALRNIVTITIALLLLGALGGAMAAKNELVLGGGGSALIGVGPGLAVFHLLTGNLGVIEVKSDLPVLLALWVTAIGLAAGFAVQIRHSSTEGKSEPNGFLVGAMLTALAIGGFVIYWRWNNLADLAALAVSGISAQLLVLSIRGRGEPGLTPSFIKDAAWLTAGMLIQVVLVFLYFAETGWPLLIGIAIGTLGLGACLSAPIKGHLPALTSGRHLPWLAGAAALLLVVGFGLDRSIWDTVERKDSLGTEITVMTYNIQTGFSRENIWSLERTAQTIEAQSPDIVILQEVSRGWMITSGVDQARWLSHRLDMNLAWGPTSDDDLWGVAILSKAKVLNDELRIYDTTGNLRRGVLGAAIKTEGDPLFVYATHLDNPKGAGDIRLEQVTQLVETVAEASPAIIGGDFNATPDSDTIGTVLNAGFTDTGDLLPPGTTTSEDNLRIDYIFVRGPVTVLETQVIETWTSDHRPVVTRLAIGG